ncbi:hypothetical protein FQN57_007268 [Myotisia sp. PD_48]|nr:hypothetical protein FQN57_007268 [Myotisia sp. PD_48]
MDLEFLFLLMAVMGAIAARGPKSVFAHYMVGNAQSVSVENWKSDITLAKNALIDGFALNIGPQDGYTEQVLDRAYQAASELGDFKMFISFDFLSAGPWPKERVIKTINKYKGSPAQFVYQNKPLVSTFEGVQNIDDWPSIREATGCFFVPDWTSLGPEGFKQVLDKVDGAFSWDAWPVGAQSKSSESDRKWMEAVGDKIYMMPISPWFYTNLPQWKKNWLWRGDDLWFDRWQQAIELQPNMIEIITWNDYGESHYIGPIHEAGIPSGAQQYILGYPHDAWRVLLPDFIKAYKSGNSTGLLPHEDIITYWYRRNPSEACDDGGTTGNNPGQGQPILKPGIVSEDKVFLTAAVTTASDVDVQIGNATITKFRPRAAGIHHFNVPFNGQRGAVKITILRNGREVVSTEGPAITTDCRNGKINWNAFVGSSKG